MTRITQRPASSALPDLLARARANVAFADDGAAGAEQVAIAGRAEPASRGKE